MHVSFRFAKLTLSLAKQKVIHKSNNFAKMASRLAEQNTIHDIFPFANIHITLMAACVYRLGSRFSKQLVFGNF